jgi:glycosyltransferase involved in cell wall biosynthesis
MAETRLERAKWHQPLVSVIVTHFNYSTYVEGALLSLLDQTHPNWECVVVDDASSPEHKRRLTEIVESIGSDKIRILWLSENVGQIPTFFAGLDATSGEFVCLLDPDDRYAETFLEEAVATHLNKVVVCPIVATDQYTLLDGQVTTAAMKFKPMQLHPMEKGFRLAEDEGAILFFPAEQRGWHWTSSSALMFRRSALKYLRPHKIFSHKGNADAYLCNGVHLLGGTLFLTKPLIYRMLHDGNDYIVRDFYSSFQNKGRQGAGLWAEVCRLDAIEALRHNGAAIFDKPRPRRKWRRSLRKRWDRFKAVFRETAVDRTNGNPRQA